MADLTIADVRAKFPQYKDMSDDDLAQGLHQKFYSDMPYEQFSQKIGLAQKPPAGYEDNPATGYHYRPNTLADNPITRSPIYGAADVVGSGVLGLLGKIASGYHGLSKLVTGEGGDAAADTVNADRAAVDKNTAAVSPGAQTVREGVGALTTSPVVDAIAKPIDKVVANAGPAVSTFVPAATEAAQDIASVTSAAPGLKAGLNAVRGGAKAAATEAAAAPAAAEGAAKPVVGTGQDAIETGRSAGFKFTPGAVESRQPGGDVPQPFSVTPEDRRAINLHNQARATELAGEHIGVPNAKTLPNAKFEEAKVPHFGTYTETGQVLGPGLKGSDDLVSTLQGQLADVTPQGALKPAVAVQTRRILAAAQSGNMSGPQMVKDISWLRANGGRSVASQLENEMETQLAATPAGSQQLGKFRDARQSLAQINDLQRAAAKGGGQISLPHLVALDAKNPNLLTGTPKLLAQTAAAAPQDFRLPSGVQPGSSPLSQGVLGKIPLVGKGTEMLLHAGEAAVKYGAKKLVPGYFDPQSEAFQNRFGREAGPAEASYFKDLGKRPAPPSKPFELSPSPGKAFDPRQGGLGPLPEGPGPREQLQLAPPEGTVYEPHQIGMQIGQGPPAREVLGLSHPEGEVGVKPVQLGLEVAQGRPIDQQRLGLESGPSGIEPHQPSLLGHEGTPEGGSRKSKPKAKKRGKDEG